MPEHGADLIDGSSIESSANPLVLGCEQKVDSMHTRKLVIDAASDIMKELEQFSRVSPKL
jgi:hypothetical protein